jgi:hypothetical protein
MSWRQGVGKCEPSEQTLALMDQDLAKTRNAVIEECAKIVDAECERILSMQTPTSDPFSVTDTVNMNLRMMAAMLPEISAAIRGLTLSRPDGKTGAE